ncbi:hypothetical protein IPC593_01640 [Pseudomonas aeruginosa]|nr:hypothetical protein IPC593_01640 [Pseudomonas aeruginosa]
MEAKARRIAEQHGHILRKSRRPLSADNEGGFMLIDAATNTVEAGERYDVFAEDVIEYFQEVGE